MPRRLWLPPSLDELKEIRQLGDKFVLPDVAVVAMIINVRLDYEFSSPFYVRGGINE